MSASLSTKKAEGKGAKKRLVGHPPFAEMVSTAILGGDPRRGTSRQGIKTNILAEHGLPDTPFNNMQINKAIRRGLSTGKIRSDRYRAGHYKIGKPAPATVAAPEKKATAKTDEKKAKAKKPVEKAQQKRVKIAKKDSAAAKKATAKKPANKAPKRPTILKKDSAAKKTKPAVKKTVRTSGGKKKIVRA